ncbi:galactose ABC transporter substrate-binding protein [Desulfovibrio sp. OttesenSCG-928-G15]|nr:galactose ABC transporter substrate-binding protein [Desulfovibrio sp. OttesenSCG-928-G15]
MKNRRITACCAVALLLTALLWGCDDKAEKPPAPELQKPQIPVLLYRQVDTYISMVKQAVTANMPEMYEVTVFDARSDQLVQDEQLEQALQGNMVAIAVNLVDLQAASRVMDKLKKAGIPVVFFNREPALNVLKSYDKARFVGTTIADAGIMQGDLIARLWKAHPEYDRNKDGKCQYIMLQGNVDNPEALARTEHSVARARELGVQLEQLGQTYVCNWDREMARQSMEFAYSQYADDMELVISNNDSMALGAIQTLRLKGFNLGGDSSGSFIPVVGVDATPDAMQAIREGSMSATVKQDAEAMGRVIARMLCNMAEGKDYLEGTGQQYDKSAVAIRIPYAPCE